MAAAAAAFAGPILPVPPPASVPGPTPQPTWFGRTATVAAPVDSSRAMEAAWAARMAAAGGGDAAEGLKIDSPKTKEEQNLH